MSPTVDCRLSLRVSSPTCAPPGPTPPLLDPVPPPPCPPPHLYPLPWPAPPRPTPCRTTPPSLQHIECTSNSTSTSHSHSNIHTRMHGQAMGEPRPQCGPNSSSLSRRGAALRPGGEPSSPRDNRTAPARSIMRCGEDLQPLSCTTQEAVVVWRNYEWKWSPA